MSILSQRKIKYKQFFDNNTLKEIIDETLARTSMNKDELRGEIMRIKGYDVELADKAIEDLEHFPDIQRAYPNGVKSDPRYFYLPRPKKDYSEVI